MAFDFAGADATIRREIPAALRRDWARLASPGTWWSGPDRVAIAAEARRAMASQEPGTDLRAEVGVVVHKVAVDSPRIDEHWVEEFAASRIGVAPYVEIIGIVSRLSAVDSFHFALGLPLEPLPVALAGEPSRVPAPSGAIVGKSFVPMVSQVSIPQTLSLVPAETVAWQDLSDALYMTFLEMDDPDFSRSMHRTQIELVAARTSQINQCFY